jgi:hypothetical protein
VLNPCKLLNARKQRGGVDGKSCAPYGPTAKTHRDMQCETRRALTLHCWTQAQGAP